MDIPRRLSCEEVRAIGNCPPEMLTPELIAAAVAHYHNCPYCEEWMDKHHQGQSRGERREAREQAGRAEAILKRWAEGKGPK